MSDSLLTGMINGAGPRQKNMSRQIDPNLALLLQAAGKGGGHYDMSGNPIMPGQAPARGLDAFYEMQNNRAQQLGGVSQSRMFARDMMAQEEAARRNGGRIPIAPPPTTPDQSYGPNDGSFGAMASPVVPALANPTVARPAVSVTESPRERAVRWADEMAGRQAQARATMAQYAPKPDGFAEYDRQTGINQRDAQDSLLGQMGLRGSNPRTTRVAAAPRVNRSQSLARRMFDAGL